MNYYETTSWIGPNRNFQFFRYNIFIFLKQRTKTEKKIIDKISISPSPIHGTSYNTYNNSTIIYRCAYNR